MNDDRVPILFKREVDGRLELSGPLLVDTTTSLGPNDKIEISLTIAPDLAVVDRHITARYGLPPTDPDRQRLLSERAGRRPMHVYDLSATDYQHPAMGDHWYWCRRHQQAEHCDWAMDGCVRIGPFMTKSEADRLAGAWVDDSGVDGAAWVPALDMEVD